MEKPRRRVRAQHRQQHSTTIPDSAQPLFNKHQTRHDNITNNNSDARHGYARRVRIARATSAICVNNGMVYLSTQKRRREEKKSVDIGGGKGKRWDREEIGISTE
ncbi:hypothetical protein N0V85_007764 [Neurospora sp. IMI 360204]|nr:hypothetical protein N0V85_007764 [Neurospora sp. IMI 360204]